MRKDYTFIVTYRTVVSTAAAELCVWVTDHDGKDGHWIFFGPSAFTTTTWAPTDATPAGARFDGDYLIHAMHWTRTTASSGIPNALWTRITFVHAVTESSNHDVYRTVEWYTDSNRQGGWPDEPQRGPLYDGDNGEHGIAARQFTFQGTAVNGAGGAGDQSLTVTTVAGGRFEVLSFDVLNGDTSNRTATAVIDDGAGNRITAFLNGTINAGVEQSHPTAAGTAATATVAAAGTRMIVAGALNRFVITVAAVAASENSAFAISLKVWGPAPTCTLAGASTPTLTTNTSRFEAG